MSYFDQMNRNVFGLGGSVGRNFPRSWSGSNYYLTDTILPALTIFSAGLVVGATVALLVAPKSGRELRDDLSRRASEIGGTVRNRLPGIGTGHMEAGENGSHTRKTTPNI